MPARRCDGQLCLRGMAGIRPRKPREWVEAREQRALFLWIRLHARQHPELRWVHAIPNGVWLGQRRGADAVGQGLTEGCHGLYVEMKVSRNGLTPEQIAFRAAVEPLGYRFVICRSWLEAVQVIAEYLGRAGFSGA